MLRRFATIKTTKMAILSVEDISPLSLLYERGFHVEVEVLMEVKGPC